MTSIVAATVMQSTAASAASLDVDTDITLPSIITLYCHDRVRIKREQIDVSVSTAAPNLSQDATGTPGDWEVSTTGPGSNQYNRLNLTGIRYVFDPTRLSLSGVCAFRALAGTSGVQVSIAPLNQVLEGPNGASITLEDMEIRDAATAGAYATTYSVNTAAGGLTELHEIDIAMDMNFSSTLYYGTYSSVADGTFSITVVANP